ncbi:hypothetical protein RhiirC2_713979 [Rhizophagus irregularis]|uniref:Uncharacterized protein n=1 Tax=Rhizophagus irregularis TaxID=588596 RepID=A0A2N1N129_9GLOM|nr:hypothetical protein RhiirC2_713979 [Rhizophagus irregularis]
MGTKTGQIKSTNRIDDIIKLTEKGEELVRQIEAGVKKDKLCWQWVMYCAGDSNSCQRKCGEIGKCMEGCQNKMLPNNQKNGYILYYQQPDLSAETSSEHFYQLTLSDRLWLKYAQRYGRNCIGIDSKYDLNNDTPVLAIVAENSAGFGPPLAFDCEHKWYYEDLPNGKGFQRITECAKNHNWIPLVLDRTILCWFHVMQTFGKNLNNWKVPWPLRYPIALAFK